MKYIVFFVFSLCLLSNKSYSQEFYIKIQKGKEYKLPVGKFFYVNLPGYFSYKGGDDQPYSGVVILGYNYFDIQVVDNKTKKPIWGQFHVTPSDFDAPFKVTKDPQNSSLEKYILDKSSGIIADKLVVELNRSNGFISFSYTYNEDITKKQYNDKTYVMLLGSTSN